MKTNFTVGLTRILMSLTLLVNLTFFSSCNKIDIAPNLNGTVTKSQDLVTTTVSSVSGFVTGTNDEPLPGALVEFGDHHATTDLFGYFEVNEAAVTANAALVTVNKPGYFKGFKTFIAAGGKDAFFRIKLMPKTIAGTVNASSGGTVVLNNGLKIAFPSNFVVNAKTGVACNGQVNIAMAWINPAAEDFNRILPGDQRGITTAGQMMGLTSYGMANVELTGASGEMLQLAAGKKATMTMPLPAGRQSFAPASIPLWYFNEKTGIWMEEGSAKKTGNTYTGEMSHFTIWNYDDQSRFVPFDLTVQDANGAPLKNALVKISFVNDPGNMRGAYTNELGQTSGIVPAEALLRLEVMGDASCGTPVYSQTFTTGTENISLGTITINNTAGMATVSGTLRNCSNDPLVNGTVIMQKNGQYYRFRADKTGAYRFSTPICDASATISLIAFDEITGTYSSAEDHTIRAGENTSIDLQACGNNSTEFINYTINGQSFSFSFPSATFAPVTPDGNFTFAVMNEITGEQASFRFSGANIDLQDGEPLVFFNASQLNAPLTMVSPIMVNLIEKPTADQVMAGQFSGVFRGPAPTFTTYNISCSFRVKCQL